LVSILIILLTWTEIMLEDQIEFFDDVIVRTSECGAGLSSLKNKHNNILSRLIDKQKK